MKGCKETNTQEAYSGNNIHLMICRYSELSVPQNSNKDKSKVAMKRGSHIMHSLNYLQIYPFTKRPATAAARKFNYLQISSQQMKR